MKKKFICTLILALCAALFACLLTGCGNTSPSTPDTPPEDDGVTVDEKDVHYYFDSSTQTLYNKADDTEAAFKVSFNASKGTASVTGHKGEISGEITVPQYIRYSKTGNTVYPVCEIGYEAFKNTAVTKVNFPKTLTKIGANAFYNCADLTALAFADGTQNVTLGSYAFYKNGFASLTLPEAVAVIGSNTFESCAKLTQVAFSAKLTEIGMNAFINCAELTSVTIPSSVTLLGNKAFSGCRKLSGVAFENGCAITEIKEATFRDCTSLAAVSIPRRVKIIGLDAFRGCTALTEISLPSSVVEIRNNAFGGCTELTSVTLPGTVETFGFGVFGGCNKLAEIEWDDERAYFRALVAEADGWNSEGHTVTVKCTNGDLVYIGTELQ